MMPDRLTLERCGEMGVLRSIAGGRYSVEYHDSTHLEPDRWLRLAVVDVKEATIPLGEEGTEQYFTIQKNIEQLPADPGEAGKKGPDQKEIDRRQRTIEDTLALSLGRSGLLAPGLTEELFDDLMKLGNEDGVIIVPDTNALYNGAVHWLLRVLRRPSVWLLPLAASLTTVQARDATVKGLLSKTKASNVKQALRSRGLVNGALGLLQRNRGRSQVVEIDPSLLRYQKTASSTGTDPDQSDILEDRLIIEAIHGVLRTMRSRTARRVVTSDVNLGRVLLAEGIDTLFVPAIVMSNEPIDCLRYDALAGSFTGAPLRAVLWELTHAFGAVRLTSDDGVEASFECYWPGKTPKEWETEVLACTWKSAAREPTTIGAPLDPAVAAERSTQAPAEHAPGQAEDDHAEKAPASSDTWTAPAVASAPDKASEIPIIAKRNGRTRTSLAQGTPSSIAILPRASLPQALRMLGIARLAGSATAPELAAKLGERTTADTVRRAANLLITLGLLHESGKSFRATEDAELVENMLSRGDLDGFSSILQRLGPYTWFLEALRDRGTISREDFVATVRSGFPSAGTYEAERLPRYLTLVGQAWSDGDVVRDGSARPTDRDATELFQQAYSETARDGLAKVINLLPTYCRLGRISPWAAKKQIERFVSERLLPQYSFEPSAGAKPVTRDEVIIGSLDSVTTEAVTIDRLHLGERPVFTVGGPSQ